MGGGVILSLLFSTPVRAAVSNRVANIKSHGVFVGTNGSDEVVLDSADLRYLASQLDVLDKTIQGLTLQSNANIAYTYHKHKKGDGTLSSGTIYSTTNPGGCYKGSGHTHDKTGTCSTKYTTHVHSSSCATKVVTVTTQCGGEVYLLDSNDYGSFVARRYRCVRCGNIWRQEASGWEGLGDPITVCGRSISSPQTVYACNDAPLNSGKVYTCGSPTNTWTLGCGKSTSSIDSAYIVFD